MWTRGQWLLLGGVAVFAARQQLPPVAQPEHGVGDQRRVFGWRAADRADVLEIGLPLDPSRVIKEIPHHPFRADDLQWPP